ncbi:hypothetical protein GCM10023201_35490 [Actinomycetospora corticicola]|uniref:Uncharacterized protein n=1 Tax=Actinomycetospora corticicola TaxID=663602 RepID=A0A7Y9E0L3_9PSEU|nr:hypothetical protein [Actinomycetospora corticicola]NYD38939.1 hypothetical protein [Actinomycetospora corticicola]
MARPRHAMRVHPLRSKGVVVGVPVAAAVAFGAHSVLGVTPLSDQQDAPATSAAAAPVQSYGLAATPPPTTLDLLSAPGDQTSAGSIPTTGAGSQAPTTTTTKIVGDRAAAPTRTEPIAAAAPAAAPSMMTFSGAGQAAPQAPQARPAAAPAVAQAASQQDAPEQTAPPQQSDDSDGGSQQQSGGGALLGLDLGVAKVSVLSFGQ